MTTEAKRDPAQIQKMFGAVAPRYDLTNTVLSFGWHHRWRRALVRWSGVASGGRILDCATGTGDLALLFAKVVGAQGEVIGTDFSPEMLELARCKAAGKPVSFEVADALHLPYPDARFDCTSMAFGIRNVSDPVRALEEMARVTRLGGKVMVLEFGQPRGRYWRFAFDAFSRTVLPRAGGWLTGQPSAYEYLRRSSAHFPCAEAFAEMAKPVRRLGPWEWKPLSGGIAYLYRAPVR